MEQTSLLTSQNQQIKENNQLDKILLLADKLDFIDIQLLRKFYMTGKEFPNDTQPYCFPLLFKEMRESHHLKIGIEAMRKRLKNLEKVGLILKVKNSNPTSYTPVRGLEQVVRAIIAKFFLISGISNFI